MKIKWTRIVFFIVIAVFLVAQLYPILWMMVSSFRPSLELSARPFSLPRTLTGENYARVLFESNMPTYLRNSAFVAVVSLFAIVLISSMVSFAISKLKFKLSGLTFSYFIIGLTIPYQVTLIPLFTMYTRAGLLNTHLGLMLPLIAFSLPVSVLLFVNFYRLIPEEISEAAIIDGCGPFRLYSAIVLPLSANTIITVVSMNFIFVWNDYVFSLIFISNSSLKTISLGLQDFIGSHGLIDWGATYAAICLSTIPTLAMYLFMNKRIVQGMTMGAVKA